MEIEQQQAQYNSEIHHHPHHYNNNNNNNSTNNSSTTTKSSSNFIIHLNEDDDIEYKHRDTPKMVKHYILGEVLGEGAYGKVKDGLDSFTQKRVAVKILKRARLKKIPGGEASVLKEIDITKKLHNKHIIKLIDHFTIEEKEKLYIVYEYIGGGTLQNLLENSPNRKLPLHQAQLDIKPDNILFTHSNLLKLSDFGVSEDSSLLEDFECLSRSYGSPAFQPPELTSFQRSFSPFKIDIWAMGVTLYLMTIDFPSDIDKDLCSLMKGILQIDHNQRFTIDQIKNHSWFNKVLDSNEPYVPLLPETIFQPLQMAYGDENDDLIFGYDSDYNNNIINNNNNNNYINIHVTTNNPNDLPTISSNHQPGNSIPIGVGGIKHIDSSSSINSSQEDLVDDDDNDGSMNNVNNLTVSIIENYSITPPTTTTTIDGHPIITTNTTIPTLTPPTAIHHSNESSVNSTPNQSSSSSPKPPLRNSSSRRPKITFESPHNKSKCTIN
eukprot:gene6185-7701_t